MSLYTRNCMEIWRGQRQGQTEQSLGRICSSLPLTLSLPDRPPSQAAAPPLRLWGQLPPHSRLHSAGLEGPISPYSSGPLHRLSRDHPSLAVA